MITVEEARERLMASRPVPRTENVSLTDAVGRVLAEPSVVAPIDVPPFANSAMDGFAVRAADLPGRLRITGEVAAGAGQLPTVEVGTAVRISTGAPMPPGADAVVPIEQATDAGAEVEVPLPVPSGDHVREAGHDTRIGDEIDLPSPLTPAAIGVLASLGMAEVTVQARPRVAILSSGEELTAPGTPLAEGHIYDANMPALVAAVTEMGGEPVPLPRVSDDPAAVEAALRDAAEAGDLVLTSGGVSVGAHDHVRDAIKRLGELDFWRIAMQPGKPLAVGRIGETAVIGLPGNPVSALVVAELLVRPLIRAVLGLSGDGRRHVRATLDDELRKDPERAAYLRVVLRQTDAGWVASPAGGQLSSQLRALAAATGLLVVPIGEPAGRAGHSYDTILLSDPDPVAG
ncbi:MAG TPA: gephyrin-like molybdotransferase Glp [Candidatus Limnocylindria bacterium]|nr:gephyrin-like molybdotransferase Glp [Candidatus Limnocylindria bacterium]